MRTHLLQYALAFLFLLLTKDFPVKEWKGKDDMQGVFFITGDGGLNSFVTDLCNEINAKGYSVAALDASSYFRAKKTPEQTVADIVAFLNTQFQNRKNQEVVLIGYSFGADVLPFIVNRLPAGIKNKNAAVILISPTESTDFETHWSDMLGGNTKRSMDVLSEINKMQVKKLITIFGSTENKFPADAIRSKNFRTYTLPGGHHYNDQTNQLVSLLTSNFK